MSVAIGEDTVDCHTDKFVEHVKEMHERSENRFEEEFKVNDS